MKLNIYKVYREGSYLQVNIKKKLESIRRLHKSKYLT